MSKINDTNWIVKMHPSIEFYNEKHVVKKFNRMIVAKNICVLPSKFDLFSVINKVDAVVTGKGTVILEATIFGKKVLAYKRNRYEKTNIFFKYNGKDDYFKKLKFKNVNFYVSKKHKDLSKKLLYLYSLKAYSTKDNLLKDVRIKNLGERKYYYLNLYKQLKQGKQIIYKSIYYKKLKKLLLNENNRKNYI